MKWRHTKECENISTTKVESIQNKSYKKKSTKSVVKDFVDTGIKTQEEYEIEVDIDV